MGDKTEKQGRLPIVKGRSSKKKLTKTGTGEVKWGTKRQIRKKDPQEKKQISWTMGPS